MSTTDSIIYDEVSGVHIYEEALGGGVYLEIERNDVYLKVYLMAKWQQADVATNSPSAGLESDPSSKGTA